MNSRINTSFQEYFHWQWVCSLLKPDFNDVHHELFELLSEKPEYLNKLSWREFEILIYELLRKQGFGVELGPGTGDGGVDIRMLQRNPIGDILTAVQVKRYRPDRKIKLQAVQALHGAALADNLQSSIFVTTSDYLPSARNFAARQNVPMKLLTSADVRRWCAQATRGIVEDKSSLVSPTEIEKTNSLTLMALKRIGALGQRRMLSRRGCRLAQDPGNRREFDPRSCLMPSIREHHRR